VLSLKNSLTGVSKKGRRKAEELKQQFQRKIVSARGAHIKWYVNELVG